MRTFILLLLMQLVSLPFSYARQPEHSTYLVAHDLKSLDYVRQIDYAQFDYIYLMAAPNWKEYDFSKSGEEIIRDLVTNHAFRKDQGVDVIQELIAQARACQTKVLLSFAGEGFRERVEDPALRAKFVDFMVAFIDKYDFDGIEVDWETAVTLPLHEVFVKDIREKLNVLESRKNRKMYLTTALHSWQRYSKELAEKVSRSLDWINIMTYDMGGGIWGNVPTHNTPLDRIITDLKAWEMFDKSKLCIGLANYGFFYKGIKPGQKIEGKLDKYGRYIGYNEAMAVFSSDWKEVKDPQAKVSYFINEKQQEFITLETKETIRTKAEWVKENGFRGAFWWEFSYDEILPDSKDGKIRHHLIDEIKW